MPGEPQEAHELGGFRDDGSDRARARPAVEVARIAACTASLRFSSIDERREEVRDLERARQTCGDDAVRRLPGQVPTLEHDAPSIGCEEARDQVEDRRLAGAVRPDQRVQRSIARPRCSRPRPRGCRRRPWRVPARRTGAVAISFAAQERRHRRRRIDRAARHRCRFDDSRAQRRRQAPPYADEARRRKYDEPDEEQPEKEQPVGRPDRQVLAKQDVEERAQRGTEQAPHPADDHHREELAREGDRRRVGGREAVMEREQHAGEPGERRRNHVGDLLVALRRVAGELRPLLVVANREQHGADRRDVEPRQRVDDEDAERRDDRVVDPGIPEIDAEPRRAGDPAQSVLAAGEGGPAKSDGVGKRREREREQREVNAAPAQHQESDQRRRDDEERQREERRPAIEPGNQCRCASAAA